MSISQYLVRVILVSQPGTGGESHNSLPPASGCMLRNIGRDTPPLLSMVKVVNEVVSPHDLARLKQDGGYLLSPPPHTRISQR